MPTNRPRINVTLNPSTFEAIRRVAAAGGGSMSAVVADVLDSVAPSMGRVAAALEAAAAAPESMRAGLIAAAERAEQRLVPLLQVVNDSGSSALAEIEHAAGVRPQHASRAVAGSRRGRRSKTPGQ